MNARPTPPQTYRRLVEMKKVYDPGNVFRLNHKVVPS